MVYLKCETRHHDVTVWSYDRNIVNNHIMFSVNNHTFTGKTCMHHNESSPAMHMNHTGMAHSLRFTSTNPAHVGF
jgi:hypothetical protein